MSAGRRMKHEMMVAQRKRRQQQPPTMEERLEELDVPEGDKAEVRRFAAFLAATSPGAGAVVPATPGAFVPLTPANLLDTGAGVGAPAKAVAAHAVVTFQVTGRGGVPSTSVGAATRFSRSYASCVATAAAWCR